MHIRNPVAVYIAESNHEAHLVCTHLEQSGIEAHVTSDDSLVGIGWFGPLPSIHKPQIWVDQSDLESAREQLQIYEGMQEVRRRRDEVKQLGAKPVEAVCEDCGTASLYPAPQRGTIQECPKCGAYVDVGEPNFDGDATAAESTD